MGWKKNYQKLCCGMTGEPKNFGAILREKDQGQSRTRLFIMGCGRSGTWLLTGIMATFQDVYIYDQENPLSRFKDIDSALPVHIVKRDHESFLTVNLIPPEIGIVFIVRHPFDILTSHHPGYERRYYVTPARWNGEMQALRWLCESRRPNTKIVRYEDLVTDPDREQQALADAFGLTIRVPASEYGRVFSAPDEARTAMHGLRAPDRNSLGRWKDKPDDRAYIARLVPDLQPQLDWIGERFGYDLNWS